MSIVTKETVTHYVVSLLRVVRPVYCRNVSIGCLQCYFSAPSFHNPILLNYISPRYQNHFTAVTELSKVSSFIFVLSVLISQILHGIEMSELDKTI